MCSSAIMRSGRTKTTRFSLDDNTLKNRKALAGRVGPPRVVARRGTAGLRAAEFAALRRWLGAERAVTLSSSRPRPFCGRAPQRRAAAHHRGAARRCGRVLIRRGLTTTEPEDLRDLRPNSSTSKNFASGVVVDFAAARKPRIRGMNGRDEPGTWSVAMRRAVASSGEHGFC